MVGENTAAYEEEAPTVGGLRQGRVAAKTVPLTE